MNAIGPATKDSLLRRLDNWLIEKAAARQAIAQQRGVTRNAQRVNELIRDGSVQNADVAARIATDLQSGSSLDQEAVSRLISQARAAGENNDDQVQQLASAMKRGRLGDLGFREAVNRGIAENAYVRRGVLPVAIAGGTTLAGKGVLDLVNVLTSSGGTPEMAVILADTQD